LTVYKSDGEGSNINWWKTANTNNTNTNLEVNASVYSIADRQQEVDCVVATNYTLDNSASIASVPTQDTTNNRQVRKLVSGSDYITIACGWGKKGQITDATNDYVACQTSTGTNFATSNTDRLAGVPVKWSNLFNVHKCSSSANTNNIPVIAAKLNATTGDYDGIDATKYTVSPNGDATKPAVFCLDTTSAATIKSGLGIANAVDGNINPLANCGLAALDLANDPNTNTFDNTGYATTAPTDYTKSSLACIACKPGYVSTGTGNFTAFARSCTAINNCNQSVT
jgi:hypothetical protein